jgi:cytochrome c-type biogenesis protein CcmE
MTAAPAASPDQPPRAVLDYPFETPPATGEATEVAPGVLWIRMPLPFSLSHINLWAIADGGRWTLVDSGLRSPETAAAWRQLRDGALGGRDIERVVVTHMHPDHVGMAGWITRRTGCRLWMTRLEYLTCRVLVADTGRDAPEDGTRFYRRAGWDEDALEHYRARFGEFGKSTYTLPDSYRRIVDGETFRIGGLVEVGSIVRGQGEVISFKVTDTSVSIPATYKGVLPDLFAEGAGMVGTGSMEGDTFVATEILARHDEEYMPQEVVDALKEQGVYVEPAKE